MNIEFDFIEGNEDKLIKKLVSRGFEYDEAFSSCKILLNIERYMTQKFTIKAQLDVLNDILESGLLVMSDTDDIAGPYYGEIMRKIKELEQKR